MTDLSLGKIVFDDNNQEKVVVLLETILFQIFDSDFLFVPTFCLLCDYLLVAFGKLILHKLVTNLEIPNIAGDVNHVLQIRSSLNSKKQV